MWGRPTPYGRLWPPPSSGSLFGWPDVRWLVTGLGWSVWSGLRASIACIMQDEIVCDFVCVFVVFSSYSRYGCLQSKNHQNLWKWFETSPITFFGVWKSWKDAGVDGFISDLRTVNNTPTLSLCSSSSKEAKTKVDPTPLKKPAYKLFQVFSQTCELLKCL